MTSPKLPLSRSERLLFITILFILATRLLLLPFYPFLDRSEARYALVSLHMLNMADWVTPTVDGLHPFWSKPPLSFWLSAGSFELFGINEFAARLPSFLIFAGLTWLTFFVGRAARGRAFGLLAACVFGSMGLAFFLAGQVMTDPSLAFCVTLTMVAFWVAMTTPSKMAGYVMFTALGLALLSKGPVGLVFPGLSIAVWLTVQGKWREAFRRLPIAGGILLAAAVAAPWYVLAELHTPGFLRYFVVGENIERFLVPGWPGSLYERGREVPLGTIWLFAFLAILPWSAVFVLLAVTERARLKQWVVGLRDPWISFLLCWGLMPLLLLTFARNLLITYVLPMMPALALLMAAALIRCEWGRRLKATIATIAFVPLLAIALAVAMHLQPHSGLITSQINVVELWRQSRSSDDAPLYYLFVKPYSADFYTRDKAAVLDNLARLPDILRQHPNAYFAVIESKLSLVPKDRVPASGVTTARSS
jgi:4-amino-4-deoxy-L-arabinose transferase-like glycosyltransferase